MRVEYTYQVNGQTYKNERLAFGPVEHFYVKKADAQYALRQFPYGKTVTVFYNPKHPQDSTLKPAASNLGCWIIIAWIVWLVGLAFGLFLSYGLWMDALLK